MPTIAVLGGGYAGVQAIRRLDRLLDRSWTITMIDRDDCHQLLTRLPEVVAGALEPSKACIPFRSIARPRINVVRREITEIDPVNRRITTATGVIEAQWLVVALGATPDYLDIPGARENGMVVKSVEQAVRLRERIEMELKNRRQVKVAVVGAGYTGTEVAGELAEWSRRLPDGDKIEVAVVAQDTRLLPEGNDRLAHAAESILRRKGVSLELGVGVDKVAENSLHLESGRRMKAHVIVWAAHSRASGEVNHQGWRTGQDGRIIVDPYLRAIGPERVYAVGDGALALDPRRGSVAPATAQLSVQEGALAAQNLVAEINNGRLEEFRPRSLGEALSLGGADGVAEVGGIVVKGRAALAVKHAAIIRYLSGLGGPRLVNTYR